MEGDVARANVFKSAPAASASPGPAVVCLAGMAL